MGEDRIDRLVVRSLCGQVFIAKKKRDATGAKWLKQHLSRVYPTSDTSREKIERTTELCELG